MGYTTDFVGHIDIHPPLNDAEIEYLLAFGASRRCVRQGGPYAVPGNPLAEDPGDFPADGYNTRAPGQPDLWCGWEVCWDGCCLTWSGIEKSYSMLEWLRYLIGHFLKPRASASGDAAFDGFSFDHVLEGQVVGCRRDTKELFAIVVKNNRVTKRVLTPPDPRFSGFPPLPYEEQNDLWERRSRRRRRRPDNVLPLGQPTS